MSSTMTPVFALQLFNSQKAVSPNLIFTVSRSCDEKQVGYFAKRKDNQLVDEMVYCRAVQTNEWKTQTELSELVHDTFYKIDVRPITKTSYSARMKPLPEREIMLAFKSDSAPGKNDGPVVGRCTFNLGDGVQVPNVQLFFIYMDMTFSALDIPDVKALTVFGYTAMENIQHLTPEQRRVSCTPLSEKQVYVTEHIPVTEEIRKRFDGAGLTKKFLESIVTGGKK